MRPPLFEDLRDIGTIVHEAPRKKGGSQPAGCYNGRAHAAAYFTGKAAYLTSKAVSFTSKEVFSMAGFA